MMMQLSKKIPFEDPDVLLIIRILYVVSNVLIAGTYLYVQKQVEKKKGMHIIYSEIENVSLYSHHINRFNLIRHDHTEIC